MFNRFHLDYYQRIAENFHYILKELNINDCKTILEVLSWWSPKLWIALYSLGYTWDFYVIDKNKYFLNELKEGLKIFSPKFQLHLLKIDIFSISNFGNFDMVIGNHIIDDLIFQYYCDLNLIKIENIYDNWELFIQIWKKISIDYDLIENIVNILERIFIWSVGKNWYLILTQYLGHIEKNFDIDSYNISKLVIEKLIKKLTLIWFKENFEINEKVYLNLNYYYFKKEDLYILKRN